MCCLFVFVSAFVHGWCCLCLDLLVLEHDPLRDLSVLAGRKELVSSGEPDVVGGSSDGGDATTDAAVGARRVTGSEEVEAAGAGASPSPLPDPRGVLAIMKGGEFVLNDLIPSSVLGKL